MAIITGISLLCYGVAVIMFFLEIKAFFNALGRNPFSTRTITNLIIVILDVSIMGLIAKVNGMMGGIPTIAGPPSALASVIASIWMYRNRKSFERNLKEAEERHARKKGFRANFSILKDAYKRTKYPDNNNDD